MLRADVLGAAVESASRAAQLQHDAGRWPAADAPATPDPLQYAHPHYSHDAFTPPEPTYVPPPAPTPTPIQQPVYQQPIYQQPVYAAAYAAPQPAGGDDDDLAFILNSLAMR